MYILKILCDMLLMFALDKQCSVLLNCEVLTSFYQSSVSIRCMNLFFVYYFQISLFINALRILNT